MLLEKDLSHTILRYFRHWIRICAERILDALLMSFGAQEPKLKLDCNPLVGIRERPLFAIPSLPGCGEY